MEVSVGLTPRSLFPKKEATVKCKAIAVLVWTGLEVSRRLMLLDFQTVGT
jgi:hypothetical protein